MDSAIALISGADRQLETAAHNVSNMTSPGYRARQSFWALVDGEKDARGDIPNVRFGTDFSIGNVTVTSNAYDLALGAEGFFVVKSDEETRFTRNGQFHRAGDGRLVTSDGFALQSDAGDLVVKGDKIEVLADGTVLDQGEPTARILVRDFAGKAGLSATGASAFSADDEGMEVLHPDMRQGALETSNVSTAHEMITMMKAMRQAETGQRMVQFYDELLGEAITNFGGTQA
ncbi:MAG TPA: flagellar hook basal-body protein [Novosphingobium sp.]